MHRTRLAEEAGAELLEYLVGIDEDLKEVTHRIRVVGCVVCILREFDRCRQLVRHLIDGDVDAEFGECCHGRRVETCNGFSSQAKLPRSTVAGRNAQQMIDEVEINPKGAPAVGNRRGRQPSRRDVQRDVPGVVQPRCAHETNLANDLGPQMQGFASVAPGGRWQFRPRNSMRDSMRITHAPPYTLSSTFSSNKKAGHNPTRPFHRRTRGRLATRALFVFAALAQERATITNW